MTAALSLPVSDDLVSSDDCWVCHDSRRDIIQGYRGWEIVYTVYSGSYVLFSLNTRNENFIAEDKYFKSRASRLARFISNSV